MREAGSMAKGGGGVLSAGRRPCSLLEAATGSLWLFVEILMSPLQIVPSLVTPTPLPQPHPGPPLTPTSTSSARC